MNSRTTDPLVQWKATHKADRRTETAIDRWLTAAIAPEEALTLEVAYEAWLRDRSADPPDLVVCISRYGYTRLLIQGWQSVPVDIELADLDRWREAHYLPTIEDFQLRLAGVAGGFLELAGQAPQLTVDILQRQLATALERLDELTALPLETYTPRSMTDDEVEDGDDAVEQRRFDAPFVIRQDLECFEWALEKYRMFAISEHNDELGLPNRKLYEALMQIDLNALLARLKLADKKLEAILQHLAVHGYSRLSSDVEPESFWWRHWKSSRVKR